MNFCSKSHNSSFNAQWNPLASSNIPKLFSEPMHTQIENFLFVISLARNSVLQDISAMEREIKERQRSEGYLKNLIKDWLGECSQEKLTLNELKAIPDVLRQCINALSRSFNVRFLSCTLVRYLTIIAY